MIQGRERKKRPSCTSLKIELSQLRKKFRISLAEDRVKILNSTKVSWANYLKEHGPWKLFTAISTGNLSQKSVIHDDVNPETLVNEISNLYRDKGNLVSRKKIDEAILNLDNQIKMPEKIINEEILFDFLDPKKFNDYFPTKIANTADSLGLSPNTHYLPIFEKFAEIFNRSLMNKPIDSYPDCNRTYYQKAIPKSNKKFIEVAKDARPIGVNSHLEKNVLNRMFFKNLQENVKEKLERDFNDFSFFGCAGLVVNLCDLANRYVHEGYYVAVTNFDLTNAFGQNCKKMLLRILRSLGLSSGNLNFVDEFQRYQDRVKTVLKDNKGKCYWSDETVQKHELSGFAQGQVGSSTLFSIFSFILSLEITDKTLISIPKSNVFHYVDDSSVVIFQKSPEDLAKSISLVNKNFHLMATACGLKANEEKTNILPVNVTTEQLKSVNLPTSTQQRILGYNIKTEKGKLTAAPCEEQIMKTINSLTPIFHKIRDTTANVNFETKWKTRNTIAKNLILSPLSTHAPLLVSITNKSSKNLYPFLEKIIKQIKSKLRILGLSCNTPTTVLLSVLGVDPTTFVRDCILTMGVKMIKINSWQTDRSAKFRSVGLPGSFEWRFKNLWNNFASDRERIEFLDPINGLSELKNFLKIDRKKNLDLKGIRDYEKVYGRKSWEFMKKFNL